MNGHYLEERWRWKLPVMWLLVAAAPTVLGYFLGDTKAVLRGCSDHWTLQDRAAMPLLFKMTVCVHIRVVVPGAWVAFSYSSIHAPKPELGLEGDEGVLYGWLLGVRHRFPFQMSPTDWHRVCLRRDVLRDSFSLEVDGELVDESTVIAHAIPPSGSLWLGCRPRHQPPGAKLGQVELYMFRVWADLKDHGPCDDGSVIGWDSRLWGVTSSKARQRDLRLPCEPRRVRRGKRDVQSASTPGYGRIFSTPFSAPPTTITSSPVTAATHTISQSKATVTSNHRATSGATSQRAKSTPPSNASPANHISPTAQTSPITSLPANQTAPPGLFTKGFSPVNCDIARLCSHENAYYWMFLNVNAKGANQTEQDVHHWVSNVFGCDMEATHNADKMDFCQHGTQLQKVEVSCEAKEDARRANCNVLLQLSRSLSECKLQLALQHAQGQQLQAKLIGQVQRVGRELCEDVEPSSGRLVRCTSSSSLDDICQSGTHSSLTCSFIEPGSSPALQSEGQSCSRQEDHFCDCSTFCSEKRQFFALSININSSTVDVEVIKSMLSKLAIAPDCDMSDSLCRKYPEVSRLYQEAHLECHGTKQRLYSCMVILEMSGPVDVCALTHFLQLGLDEISGITNDEPLARMAVCGSPGLDAGALLASNLTWVASELLISEICQSDHTLLKCNDNETFAVLLKDRCLDPPPPLPTNPSTQQPSTPSNSNLTTETETTPPSLAATTQQNNTTAENDAGTQSNNQSENTTTQLPTLNSTQNPTAQPQGSTQNISTAALNFSTTAMPQNTTPSNNITFNITSPSTGNTVNTSLAFAVSPNTTSHNITEEVHATAFPGNTTQPNTTAMQINTTQLNITDTDHTRHHLWNSTYPNTTALPVHTAQPNTSVHNATTATDSGEDFNTTATTTQITTPGPDNATLVTTTANNTADFMNTTTLRPTVTVSDNTTVHNTTASGNTTLLTPTHNANLHNATTTQNNATQFTPSNSTVLNATTPSLRPADNQTLQNTTAASNSSTLNTTTFSPSYTTTDNITTTTNNQTFLNVTLLGNATLNATTLSPNYTTADSIAATADNQTVLNVTLQGNATLNATTLSPNYTRADNTTNLSENQTIQNVTVPGNATLNATASSANYTTTDSMATTADNQTVLNITLPGNATLNATTLSPNYTRADNITTITNNQTFLNDSLRSNATLNATTLSPNYTTTDNTTDISANQTIQNVTVPGNATLNATTRSPNYTTADLTPNTTGNQSTLNITFPGNATLHATTLPPDNKTDNMTTANAVETQQNTTAPYNNTTVFTTEIQGNETQFNATTSPDNSTLHDQTSAVDNQTLNIPTVAPVTNHTANYTTMSTPHNVTKNPGNDTSSTVNPTATSSSTFSKPNTSTEANFTFSSAPVVVNPDFNQTTRAPVLNLTTPATTPLETNATAAAMITTARPTTTTNGSLPAQTVQSTTVEVSLTTETTTPVQTTTTTSKTTTSTVAQEATTNSQEEQIGELLDQTQDASQLNSSQVAQVVEQLERLLEGPTVSESVGQKAVDVISNLMRSDPAALSASTNRLIRTVEDLGLKLILVGESALLSSDSLGLLVAKVDGSNFREISISFFNTDDVQLNGPRVARSRRSDPVLGSVVLPSSLTDGLSPEEQRQASRVQFTFYPAASLFQDAALGNQTIVSPVLASSVANLSISNLSENIQFTIRYAEPAPANFVASCVFWDFSVNGGSGGWNPDGCSALNATQEYTTCSCSHLTSFAILLDVSRGVLTDRRQALILTFITYIGCGISAIFLAVTLLTYISFQKLLRDIPSKILVQLCLSFLFLNLIFLLDGWLSLYPAPGLCISTAFFLHYFLLTSFTWAGLEALHMYLSIVQVFTPYLSRYMLKFSLVGWGLPLIVVIIVISVDKNNYGLVTYGRYTDGTSDDFCWLRNDIAFYVGVVAYFLLIFALSLLVFIVVLVQLARIKKQNPQNQSPHRGLMTDLRSIAGLIILLGLTWGFALFAWGPLYLPFIYLFSIFNSLQGFFIFVFHCAVKENVRRQWRTYLCCGSLRLAENSEWSRTATQNPKKQSVTVANSSTLLPTSRSSSVISDSTNSSGSVFADSGISDSSNSDVVLNEIHRRNVALQDVA